MREQEPKRRRQPIVRRAAIVAMMLGTLVAEHSVLAADQMTARPQAVGTAAVSEGVLSAAARRAGERLAQDAAPAARPQRWGARHPVLLGTLIGTGVGFGLSRTDAIGGRNHDPKVALLGTGSGALAGLVASVVQKRRRHEAVGAGTKIALVSSLIGAVTLGVACASYCGGN